MRVEILLAAYNGGQYLPEFFIGNKSGDYARDRRRGKRENKQQHKVYLDLKRGSKAPHAGYCQNRRR